MSTIHVTDSNGEAKTLEYRSGDSLMEVLVRADYPEIPAICGGCCSCATCHVHIPEHDRFTMLAIEEDELAILPIVEGYNAQQSRLSCQISLGEEHDGLKVVLIDEE